MLIITVQQMDNIHIDYSWTNEHATQHWRHGMRSTKGSHVQTKQHGRYDVQQMDPIRIDYDQLSTLTSMVNMCTRGLNRKIYDIWKKKIYDNSFPIAQLRPFFPRHLSHITSNHVWDKEKLVAV